MGCWVGLMGGATGRRCVDTGWRFWVNYLGGLLDGSYWADLGSYWLEVI